MSLSSVLRRPITLGGRVAVCGVVIAGLGAAVAFGGIPGPGGTISGCYGKASGKLRLLDPTAKSARKRGCKRSERPISWNQTGPAGAAGTAGAKGDAGPAGAKGEKGEQGDAGPAGVAGENGEKGDAGPAGAKGEKGEKGDAGPAGVAGENGEKGDAGPAGVAGENGEKGEDGPPGPKGAAGPAGQNGDAGPAGPKGDPGPQGAKGEDGAPGPRIQDLSELGGTTCSRRGQAGAIKVRYGNEGTAVLRCMIPDPETADLYTEGVLPPSVHLADYGRGLAVPITVTNTGTATATNLEYKLALVGRNVRFSQVPTECHTFDDVHYRCIPDAKESSLPPGATLRRTVTLDLLEQTGGLTLTVGATSDTRELDSADNERELGLTVLP